MASQPTAPPQPPPPDVPSSIEPPMAAYLRTFALWCRNMFQDRLPAHTALPGVLLQAWDAPAGTNPKVFMIQVNTAGAIIATPVPLGGGQP